MREVEAPGQQIRECRARDGGWSARAVRPDHGNTDRAGVEPFGVCADDWFVDASVTALEDLSELVDEKVVADVVPTVALHVVDLDPTYDRRRLRRGVRVTAGRVMDEGKLEGACVARWCTSDRLVRTPGLAVDQQWGAGQRNPPQRNPYFGAADEVGPEPGDTPVQPVLDPVGRSCPVRIAHTPAARGTRLGDT